MYSKISSLIFALLIVCFSISQVSAKTEYQDSESDLTFLLPDGWQEKELSQEREFLDAKFVKDADVFIYGSTDIWDFLTDEEKNSFGSRTAIDNSFFSKSDIAETMGVDETEVSVVTYGGNSFYNLMLNSSMDLYGYEIAYSSDVMVIINNGWMYQFQYSGDGDDFDDILNSISFSQSEDVTENHKAEAKNTGKYTSNYSNNYSTYNYYENDPFSFSDILFSLIVTILIYTTPVVLFRYYIRKKPLKNKSALIFTIVYALVGFFIISLLHFFLNGSAASGGGLLLWSFVNYKILTHGNECLENDNNKSTENKTQISIAQTPIVKQKTHLQSRTPITQVPLDKPNIQVPTAKPITQVNPTEQKIQAEHIERIEVTPVVAENKFKNEPVNINKSTSLSEKLFCRKCGAKLALDSEFCHKCGKKIIKEEDI